MSKKYLFLLLFIVFSFTLISLQSKNNNIEVEKNIKPKNGILINNSSLVNYTENYIFSSTQLKSDFEIFRQTLKNEHGGIYKYTSKQEMNHLFDSIQNVISDSMDIISFYNLLSLCVARIKCEHTKVKLPHNLKETIYNGTGFPIFVFKNQYGSFIEHNYSKNNKIIEGSRLLKINNRSIEEINKIIFQHLSSDGEITTRKDRGLSGIRFPYYYKLFISDTCIFKVNYVTPDGANQIQTVYADTLNKINEECLLAYNNRMAKDIRYKTQKLSDSLDVAYLKINRFRLNKNHTRTIDSIFKHISDNNIKNLIIDLRDNPGGNGSHYLYSFLTSKEFILIDSAFIRTRKFKYAQKYSSSSGFIMLINKLSWLLTKKISNEKYLVKKNFITKKLGADEIGIQQPSSKNNYAGKVYLIINGATISEASIFSSAMYNNKSTIIIGEESGGSYYGPTSSIVPKIELPQTKIQFTTPLVKISLPVSGIKYGKGTLPHYYIQENIKNRINNTDTILNFTMDLIRNKKDK